MPKVAISRATVIVSHMDLFADPSKVTDLLHLLASDIFVFRQADVHTAAIRWRV
ncbi:unnamed protein product [Gongylonema pulchrum]|uniref:STAS domain-containing protein n=1 Tax=Gongylonema pulchrum TaxID=637853 RepID=A0A183DGZ8_9BILA|nr:unnamed protein product [Gongylonema pulchrum]